MLILEGSSLKQEIREGFMWILVRLVSSYHFCFNIKGIFSALIWQQWTPQSMKHYNNTLILWDVPNERQNKHVKHRITPTFGHSEINAIEASLPEHISWWK